MKRILEILVAAALCAVPLAAQDSAVKSAQVFTYSGVPASGTSEVDTITIGGTPTGGTFTITVAGSRTTGAITWSATDATLLARVDAALEALPVVGAGGVTTAAGTLSSGIGTITLTFTGKNARRDFPALSATSSLTGTDPTVEIATSTPGVEATFRSAPTGTIVVNSTTGTVYSNTSTTAGSPTWTAIVGLAVATSADLRGVLGDETGTGVAVFGTSPTIAAPVISGGLTASGSAANDFSSSTGAFKTSTGATTISGAAVLSTATRSGAGALSAVKGTTKVTSTGTGDALTLGDGVDGQVVTVIHDVDGGSAVLTPTTKTGFTTITFTDAGESATLQFVTTRGWIILALNGAVAE
jgi:hypothetical protein